MRALLTALAGDVAASIERPAEPRVVMDAFCAAMGRRVGRPVRLEFRAFPDEIPVSGLRLDFGEESVIVVEERMPPESRLVILGHELYHEEKGDIGHRSAAVALSARGAAEGGTDDTAGLLRCALEGVLGTPALHGAVAARAHSADAREVDAETFGLLFGHEVRTWMTGRYARGPVSAATVEGRINLSMGDRGGRLL